MKKSLILFWMVWFWPFLICAQTPEAKTTIGNQEAKIEIYIPKTGNRQRHVWKKPVKYVHFLCTDDGFVIPPEKFEKICAFVIESRVFNKRYKYVVESVIWPDEMTDGTFDLTIYPNFMYLGTGHNNPNSNEFIWYTQLTKPQYKAICGYLKNRLQDKSHFNVVTPGSLGERYFYWTPASPVTYQVGGRSFSDMTQDELNANWEALDRLRKDYAFKNLQYLLRHFNQRLNAGESSISLPSRESFYQKSILMVSGLHELD